MKNIIASTMSGYCIKYYGYHALYDGHMTLNIIAIKYYDHVSPQ